MDLALDETTHDLKFVNGDMVFYDGLDATAQRLKIKLWFFLGEWFLDQRVGIPYWEQVFIKNPNQAALNALFRKVIQEDEAVLVINQFEFVISETRAARLTFKVETTDGPLTFDEEFVVA